MKTLLVLRHAKSSWKEVGLSDHDRPLNERGKRDAPRIGQLLAAHKLLPDAVLSSTAKRARKTAARVVKHAALDVEVELRPELYHAGPANYLEVLRAQPDHYQSLLVVGHNPGLEQLVEELTGEQEMLPTAALVHIELEIGSWSELALDAGGTLKALWRPRELD